MTTQVTEVESGIFVTYDHSSAPVKAVRVANPKGYLDLNLTMDTTDSGKKRIKVETRNGAVFIGAKRGESLDSAVSKFVTALEILLDNGIDQSAAA